MKHYFLLFLVVLFFGCTEKKQEGFLLTGELTNAAGKTLLIEYKNGKKGLFGLFMGEVMKLSQGKADPKITNQLIK